MVRLSVNINKIALIRNSRGANLPNLVQVAKDCISYGAQGITVHPRPDERHIRKADIPEIKSNINVEFNIEGYPSDEFIKLVLNHKPDQVTLVPDPPEALTSNTGWDTKKELGFLKELVSTFKKEKIRVSLFHNPEPELIPFTAETGTDRIELYTGEYAHTYKLGNPEELKKHINTAKEAIRFGLGINAGHDLNLDNLKDYTNSVPGLMEVSIGHALICDSLYWGLQNTIQMYLARLKYL